MAKVKTLEELIKEIMREAEADGEPVTEEEAREMAEMEIKAKDVKLYAKSEKETQPRKPKEKKVDLQKQEIIKVIFQALEQSGYQVEIVNDQQKIGMTVNGNAYSVTLTKHGAKWKGY